VDWAINRRNPKFFGNKSGAQDIMMPQASKKV